MSTIKLPKNMTFLTGHLPKPKYDDRRTDKRIRHTRTVCHIESETDMLKPSVSLNKVVSPVTRVRRVDKTRDPEVKPRKR